ncbi:MAG TPA: 16S rRNA (guanine(527)-N(7))-methyltransferase RsmG [Steroidobacteraceae bacterium]|nr:16S rRNA (guanine(527)-N(7))-methyltransferase RsmG [Steroidobacteraceae bacterium]
MTARPTGVPLGRDGFARVFGVSRETLARLEAYVALLKSWNRRINLVGATTLGDPWRRHILDSAQLLPQVPEKARVLVDLGSGAGLPGLVLSVLGVPEVHLVESDQKKAVFLREAVRVTGAAATVHAVRAERFRLAADVVTARAVASLPELLELAAPFLAPHSVCLFLKGRTVREELTLAEKSWKMRARLLPSATDPGGTLLLLEAISRLPP